MYPLRFENINDLSRCLHPKYLDRGNFGPSIEYLDYLDSILSMGRINGFSDGWGYNENRFFSL